jgi:AcrR family transcriptional regulator
VAARTAGGGDRLDGLLRRRLVRAVGHRDPRAVRIAPTALYRLFASKEVIAAYVERAHEAHREWFRTTLDRGGDDPRERVRALFDEQNTMLQPEVCRGCPFLTVLTEFPDETLASH